MPSMLKMRHSAFWLTPSAFHCGSSTTARCPLAGNQRALTRLFSGIGRRHRRGEAQELAPLRLSAASSGARCRCGRVRPCGARCGSLSAFRKRRTRRCSRPGDRLPPTCTRPWQSRSPSSLRQARSASMPGQLRGPVQAPLEGTHDAIVVARGHARLPVVDPAAVMFSHLLRW